MRQRSAQRRLVNWLVNVCLLGLLPVIARLFVWMISDHGVTAFASSDIVVFGIVLQSFSISELSRQTILSEDQRTIHLGLAIIFTVLFGLLLAVTISAPQTLNAKSIIWAASALSIVSFLLGFSIISASTQEGA